MRRNYLASLAVGMLVIGMGCKDTTQPVAPDLSVQESRGIAQDRMENWHSQASPAVLELAGTVFTDNDEVNGKIRIGVENRGIARAVEGVMSRLAIPTSAYTIDVVAPIVQMATLRDRFRPTQAGTQIHFGNYLCTMGFNVDHAGGRSFITNSHCTNTQGGVEGTQYYQPLSSVDATVIATEVADPTYFRNGACPRGKKCRYSDSSRELYASSVASERGLIAATGAPNNGSLNVTGSFTITSQGNVTSGTVNKVGRTTGWTQGAITGTCVNTNVSGSNIAQLCQTFVAAGVGGGDSGSPVFRITSGNNVQLAGILWGGSSNGASFVYSPISQIQQELGAVTATR